MSGNVPVLGLAGGIGAGKSAAGAWLAGKGALVLDSDARAKALLRTPDVRDELLGWWGPGVIGPDGWPDRAAIAARVFADPTQRARLEGLIHPMLKRERDAAIAAARASSIPPPLIVIDAPLLFEAGLDRECDCVLFVDAPLPARLARVLATRGWSEAELTRREAAQWPVDRKRAASAFVVLNDGTPERLYARLAELWPQLVRKVARA